MYCTCHLGLPKAVRCCIAAKSTNRRPVHSPGREDGDEPVIEQTGFGFDSLIRVRDTDGLELIPLGKST